MTGLILILAGWLAFTAAANAAGQASSDKILSLLYQAQAKLADEGNVASMFLVGTMYEEGTGVAQDFKLALLWYRRAEEAGHPEAASRIRQLTAKENSWPGGKKSAIDKGTARAEGRATRKPTIEEQLEQERLAAERARKEAERLKSEAARVQQLEEQLARQKQEAENARRQAEKARQSEEQLAKERAIEAERMRLQAEKARLLEEQLARERADAERIRAEAEKARLTAESARGSGGAAAARNDQTAKSELNDSAGGEFKANPCDTPAARFMSTCH